MIPFSPDIFMRQMIAYTVLVKTYRNSSHTFLNPMCFWKVVRSSNMFTPQLQELTNICNLENNYAMTIISNMQNYVSPNKT